jgi:DNA-binding response OmpR family regulator
MPADPQFRFDPYRLEVSNEQLWCGAQPLRLTSKAFRVLQCCSTWSSMPGNW